MKSKNCHFSPKNRRGLSSVVGALLFVVLMVATFSVLGIALNTQTDIVSTARDVSDIDLKKQQEEFIINNVVQVPGGSLQILATNKGQNSAEIFTLIITNSSDIANGFPTTTFEIPSDTSFLSPNADDSTDIVETLNLKMKTPPIGETDTYKFKVISSLGTIKQFNLVCDSSGLCGQSIGGSGGTGDLAVQLFLDGPNGVNTKISTVIMFVSNVGDGNLKEIWPDVTCPTLGTFPSIINNPPSPPAPPGLADFTSCETTPAIDDDPDCGDGLSGACLVPGQTMIFKFDGTISGDIGDVFTFCNSVSGKQLDDTPVSSNIDCDSLTVIDPNDCGGCGAGGGGVTLILIDDLLTRPSLFMVVPSPFGDDAADVGLGAVWGVNLVNPTEVDMIVSKLTIVVYPPTANDADAILIKDSGMTTCIITAINPTTDWSCPKDNTILWQPPTPAGHITLDARTAVEMLVAVEPGKTAAGTDIDALIVQANVFTTLGSFGKGEGYQSTMRNSAISLVNVFLQTTDTVAPIVPTIADRTDFHGINTFPITEYVKEDFYVSLADMDDDNITIIETGSRFIINVPREWTEVCIIDDTGFVIDMDGDPTPCVDERVVELEDGSTQITVFTAADIGGPTAVEADVAMLHFEARPPCNDIVGSNHPYIMYVLADGLAAFDPTDPAKYETFPIGPLNEIALVVGYDAGLDRSTCVPPQ